MLNTKSEYESKTLKLCSVLLVTFPYFSHIAFDICFAPVIDGELLTDDPNNVLMNVESAGYIFYRSLDVVIGTVSGDSSLLLNIFTSTLQDFLKCHL
jgi:hypothetical protein